MENVWAAGQVADQRTRFREEQGAAALLLALDYRIGS